MDAYLASDIARLLDTSIPRVQRAIKRLELRGQRPGAGRGRFTAQQVARLRDELGVTPHVPGLSLTQVRVLAALARAPLGVASIRVLAGRAGLSPTATSRAVASLLAEDLVVCEERMVAAGNAQSMRVFRSNVLVPRWRELAPSLARVTPPRREIRAARRVPRHLRHLFWNTTAAQMRTDEAGGYIARRLISSADAEGLAWGAAQLNAEDWGHAARTRGLAPRERALAHNLAAAAVRSRS